MIIEKVNKHAETQEERAKRLYQVGNVIDSYGNLYLVINVEDEYALYDLKSGNRVPETFTTLSALANSFYLSSDTLVTKLTYETED